VGTGLVDVANIAVEVEVLFETNQRCSLPAVRRGADANFDTRLGAADITATIRIVVAG
jgi:hypothetical protein